MAIEQHTCYTILCDECQNPLEGYEAANIHFSSEGEAIDEAFAYDWIEMGDGMLICDHCVDTMVADGRIIQDEEYDENDLSYRESFRWA